jgi:tRNA dimethylallyltransferase
MPFNVIWIGLTVANREHLRQSIKARFAEQLRLGLMAEAQTLHKRFGDCRTLLHSVNYTEFLRHFKGELTEQSAQEQCLLHNNQLARRQLIWFRANTDMNWFEIDRINDDQLFSLVHARVSESLRS